MINPKVAGANSVSSTDKVPYIQPVLGGKEGWITEHEGEYAPLPKGFIMTFVQ